MYSLKLPFMALSCASRAARGVSIVKWQKALCSHLCSVSLEQIMLQSFLPFFYSIWIKSRIIKQFTFSFFLNRSELLDVLLICNIQKCLPADQPRSSNAVIPLQTSGWWFACFIQIILFLKYSEQLNCSWDKKIVVLAGRFLISKGRKWHWEVLVWVYAFFENNFFFFKEKLKSSYLDCCLQV